MSEDINVTFIIPKDCKNEDECSEEMQLAFVVSFFVSITPHKVY